MLSVQKLAVIGDPIAHSLSPALQNFLIQHFALPFTFEALHIRHNDLPEMTQRLRDGEFRGINVTLPHKQTVLSFLDALDATAVKIGAVNTIVVEEGRLIGYNTDARGFSRSLETAGVAIADKNAFVLGAGGAARAVIFALVQANARQIIVCNRSPDRAATLIAAFASQAATNQLQCVPWSERADWIKKNVVNLLINTTRVGMHPHDDESPLPVDVFAEPMTVIDLVYNPRQTQFLHAANSAGEKIVNGLGMLIYQGVAAMELWWRKQLEVGEVYSSLENELMRVLKQQSAHSRQQPETSNKQQE
jgi:shikimate dehydrogenase